MSCRFPSLFDEYEAMLETLDILATEPNLKKELLNTLSQMQKGDYTIWNADSGNAIKKQRKKKKKN